MVLSMYFKYIILCLFSVANTFDLWIVFPERLLCNESFAYVGGGAPCGLIN